MFNITKKDYQKALEKGEVVIVGNRYSQKNGWVGFNVYLIQKNQMIRIRPDDSLKALAYWDKKRGSFYCGAWGTDRRLEVILSIGYVLGLKFSEIRQNYRWLQD